MKSAMRKKRKHNEFEKLVLEDCARTIMQTAERDPRQTLKLLYDCITIDAMTVDQLYDFVSRWKLQTLWSDPKLQHLTRGIGYKSRGEA